jgi:hypothetical protein
MLYIPSWTTRTSWNHNYKLYVEARSRTDLIITFIVSLDIVRACQYRKQSFCAHVGIREIGQKCQYRGL